MDGQAEALRVAGFGQQGAGARRVVGERRQRRVMPVEARRGDLVGRHRAVLHRAFGQRGAVQRHRQRAAHPRIAQRVGVQRLPIRPGDIGRDLSAAIDIGVVVEGGSGGDQARTRIRAHAGIQPRRHRIHHIDIAGEQGGDARAVDRDEAIDHPFPGFGGAPIGRRAFQRDISAVVEAHPAIRAGANRGAAPVEFLLPGAFRQRGADDHDGGEIGRQ